MVRRLVLAALVVAGSLAAIPFVAAPAVAHGGGCNINLTRPSKQSSGAYSMKGSAIAGCDVSHNEMHIKASLQAKRRGTVGYRRASPYDSSVLYSTDHISAFPESGSTTCGGWLPGRRVPRHLWRVKLEFFYTGPSSNKDHYVHDWVGEPTDVRCAPTSWLSSGEAKTTDQYGNSDLSDTPAGDDFEGTHTSDDLGSTSLGSKTWQNDVSANNWGIQGTYDHDDYMNDGTDDNDAAEFMSIDGGGGTATSYVYINSGVTDVTQYSVDTTFHQASEDTWNVGTTINHGASQYVYCISKLNANNPDGNLSIGGKLDNGSETQLASVTPTGTGGDEFTIGVPYALTLTRQGNKFTCTQTDSGDADDGVSGTPRSWSVTWTGTSTDTDGLTSGRAGLRVRKNGNLEDENTNFMDFEVDE